MAASIKTKLILDNSSFNTGMRASTAVLKSFSAGAGFALGMLKKFTIGVTAAGVGLSALIVRQTSVISTLQETAQKLGIGVEFLQKFRYAANQTGVSVETADMAMQRFTRRIAEAAQGGGEAYAALRQLGIQVRDNTGKLRPMEQILNDVADGIANTADSAERVRLAFKFFDSEGVSLVNTLRNGSVGLQAFYRDAESLGAILTADAAEGTKKFGDQLTRLQTLIGGVANQFTAALAPVLEKLTQDLVDYLAKLADQAGGWENLGNYLKDKFIKILQDVTVGFVRLFNSIANGINNASGFLNTLGMNTGEIQNLKDGIEDLRGELDKPFFLRSDVVTGETAKVLKEEFGGIFLLTEENINKSIELLQARIAELEAEGKGGGLLPLLPEPTFFINQLEELTTAAQTANQEIAESMSGEMIVTAKRATSWWQVALDKVFGRDRMTKFWQAFDEEGVTVLEKVKAAFELVLGQPMFDKLKTALENASIGYKGLADTIEQGLVGAVTKFEDSLADAIQTGKLSFTDLGNHIRQVLAKAIVQKFITGPLLAMFGLPGLASGGPVSAGGAYVVGEEGPELFVPKTAGTVVPNNQMGNGAGVGATQVTYNINAVDAMSFKQMVARDPEFIYSVTQVGARRLPR